MDETFRGIERQRSTSNNNPFSASAASDVCNIGECSRRNFDISNRLQYTHVWV